MLYFNEKKRLRDCYLMTEKYFNAASMNVSKRRMLII